MSNMFLTPHNVEFNSSQRVVCLIGFHVRGFVKNPDDFRAVKGVWITVMGRRVDAVYWETACDNPDLVALEVQGTAIIAFGWGGVEGRRRAIEQIRRSNVWVNGEIVRNAVMTIQRLVQIDPLNGQSVFVGDAG